MQDKIENIKIVNIVTAYLIREKNVVRLYVQMNNIKLVNVLKALDDLPHKNLDLLLCQLVFWCSNSFK